MKFAYTAARLAAGVITFEEVGPAYSTEENAVKGVVSSVSDPFGSIALNVLSTDFKAGGFAHGDMVHVTLIDQGKVFFDEDVLYAKSFGFVPVGSPILFDSSTNYIELGINQGNFKEKFKVREGQEYILQLKRGIPQVVS